MNYDIFKVMGNVKEKKFNKKESHKGEVQMKIKICIYFNVN